MTKALVWLPHSYSGSGPAESCVRIIEQFPDEGFETCLFVNRAKAPVPDNVTVIAATGGPLRQVPYRFIVDVATYRLARQFSRAIDEAAAGSIAYFWPNPPIALVKHAKSRGLVCVREMINSPLAHSKAILDAAYQAAGLARLHGLTVNMVEAENAELALYDYIFSSNAEVDRALVNLGIDEEQILKTSFGWTRARFAPSEAACNRARPAGFRAVFVGLMNVRKGIPTLLAAWGKAEIEGELLLAGVPEQCLEHLVTAHCASGAIQHLGRVDNVAALYRSCDVFVFPTHEEGGPQVTYEAAACGVPIITTPMGAARLVEDGKTGLIVPPGNPEALAEALARLARDPALRMTLSAAALAKVDDFEYAAVGRARANLLASLV